MVYNFDGHNYLIRLDKGEKLTESLERFAKEIKIKGGWLNGLGGALQMTLGFYDLDAQKYLWKDFKGLFEITALQGNIALDETGKPLCHIHGTFADKDYQVIGGHVKDLTAAATVELFFHRSPRLLKRSQDDSVGLKTLDL